MDLYIYITGKHAWYLSLAKQALFIYLFISTIAAMSFSCMSSYDYR